MLPAYLQSYNNSIVTPTIMRQHHQIIDPNLQSDRRYSTSSIDFKPQINYNAIPKSHREGSVVLPPISELMPPRPSSSSSVASLVQESNFNYGYSQPQQRFSRSSSYSSASSSPSSSTFSVPSPTSYPTSTPIQQTSQPTSQSQNQQQSQSIPSSGSTTSLSSMNSQPQSQSSQSTVQQQLSPQFVPIQQKPVFFTQITAHQIPQHVFIQNNQGISIAQALPQRSYSMVEYHNHAIPVAVTNVEETQVAKKQIRRRTRTGCLTCRKRRIKCDERKPGGCRNCEKSKVHCLGYQNKPTKNELKKLQKQQQQQLQLQQQQQQHSSETFHEHKDCCSV